MIDLQQYTLNFGPQHPAAHGVLRLVLELEAESSDVAWCARSGYWRHDRFLVLLSGARGFI